MSELRSRVLYQFKELLYMAHVYPKPYRECCDQIKAAYRKQRHLKSAEEIEKALSFGEYIKKEIVALHQLKTYRTMKDHYYN